MSEGPYPIVGGASERGIKSESRIKVSYQGVYDFDKIYRDIVNFFKKHGYFFNEKVHIEIVRSTGKDHKIDFFGEREVDEYCKFRIDVEIWALRTVKVGKTENFVNGDIQLRFKGEMTLDQKNKFERYGKIGKVLRRFYNNYIIKKRIWTKYAADIYTETNELISIVKSDLGLITA